MPFRVPKSEPRCTPPCIRAWLQADPVSNIHADSFNVLYWRMAPVRSGRQIADEGAPGPSPLGTGETPDLNWQEEPHGLAGSVPPNPHSASNPPQKFSPAVLHIISPFRRILFP